MNLDLELAVAAAAVFVAGLARGFIGFGAALVMMPVLILIYGPVASVVILTLLEVPATAFLLPTAIRHADWRAVAPLGIASLATIPLGAWLLVSLDADNLRRFIAILVIGFGLLLASGWRYARTPSLPMVLAVGAFSGLVGGAANISGPPVVIFLMAGRNSAVAVRAGIMAYFSYSTLLRVALYAWHGLYASATLWIGAILTAPYMTGIWIGSSLFRGVSEVFFRRFVTALVLVMGAAALLK